jgi:hypothetical protein
MTDEPVVRASAGWLLEHGLWAQACALTGLGEWAVNEGQMGRDEAVTLTLAQAEAIGLLRVASREASRQPVIVRAVQTCDACPSQWDAWDAEGAYWYLRYRFGQGTARQAGAEGGSTGRDGEGEPGRVLSFRHGDPLDGSISLEEFCVHAGLRLELED